MGVGSSTMSTWAKKNVFERVTQLLRSPNIKKPAWYDAAVAVPPPRKAFRSPKPARMQYREEALLHTFFQRIGEDSYRFIHMPGANDDGPAAAFVRRQLELMDTDKIPARKAFDRVLVEAETEWKVLDAASRQANEIREPQHVRKDAQGLHKRSLHRSSSSKLSQEQKQSNCQESHSTEKGFVKDNNQSCAKA